MISMVLAFEAGSQLPRTDGIVWFAYPNDVSVLRLGILSTSLGLH